MAKRLEIGFVLLLIVFTILFVNALRVAHSRGIPIWDAAAGVDPRPQPCVAGPPALYPYHSVPRSHKIA